MNNGQAVQQQTPEQQQLQAAVAEAMFWKTKYFELLRHSNEVIAALSRPSITPDQLMQLVQAQAAAQGQNMAQEPSESQESTTEPSGPNRAERRKAARETNGASRPQ